MLATLYSKLGEVKKLEMTTFNEEMIRNDTAGLLSTIHRQARKEKSPLQIEKLRYVSRECLKVLDQLQNRVLVKKKPGDIFPQWLDFSEFFLDLVSAADLCLCSKGNRLEYVGEDGIRFPFDADVLQIALYNLIAVFARDLPQKEKILVKLSADAKTVRVSFSKPRGEVEINEPSLKLDATKHAAFLHKGVLLVRQEKEAVEAVFTMSRQLPAAAQPPTSSPPNYIELMCDRLSPLYIGLAEICQNPI